MALTLVQFWEKERATYTAIQSASQADLASAQANLVDAKSRLEANVTASNKLKTDIAANRAKLPVTPVPSDLAALNEVLRGQFIEQRRLQGVILDDHDAVAWATSTVAASSKSLARVSAQLGDVQKALEAATTLAAQREQLKTKLTEAPFDTLQADATAALTDSVAIDAKAAIEAAFPASLLTLAQQRVATRIARDSEFRKSLLAAETALGNAQSAGSGASGKVEAASLNFQRAVEDLQRFANSAASRFDGATKALRDLQELNNGTANPGLLSAQQLIDVAESSDRTDAADAIVAVDDARQVVNVAIKDFDAQIITQINSDVDALGTSAAVKAKRDAVAAKNSALETVQQTVTTDGHRTTMDEWQIIVQDRAWQALVEYADAIATLAELKATAPASLVSATNAAEDAFATTLAAAATVSRTTAALNDVVSLRRERATTSTAALPARLLSAARGDSF